MTDPNTPLSDDDLSAAIDGQAGPDVVERLRTDPVAQARYRELDAARARIADDPIEPLGPSVVDQLVGRALAATDPTGDAPAPEDADATRLTAPPRPAGRRSGPPPWAVAAVVTLLVAIGLGLVWSGQRSDDSSTQATSAPSESASTEAAGGATANDAGSLDRGAGEEPSVTAGSDVATLVDLGAFATRDELRSSLRDGVPSTGVATDTTGTTDAPTTDEVQRCETQLATLLQGEGIGPAAEERAFAVVDGDPKLVYEFTLDEPTDDASALISAVDPTTCDPLITFYR